MRSARIGDDDDSVNQRTTQYVVIERRTWISLAGCRKPEAYRRGRTSLRSSNVSFLLFAAHGAPRQGRSACPCRRQCRGSCFLATASPASLVVKPSGCHSARTTTPPVGNGFSCRCLDDVICYLMNPFTRATIPLPSLSSYNYYEQPVEFGDDMWLSHMVFFQEQLYALDNVADLQDLIAIDFVNEDDSDEPRVSRIEHLIEGVSVPHPTHSACMHYLLQSHGSLLMICRKLSYTLEHDLGVPGSSEFEVFKADFEQHSWAEVRQVSWKHQGRISRKLLKPEEVDPLMLICGGTYSVDYSTTPWRCTCVPTEKSMMEAVCSL
ncbi:hypothetical protein U9M48_005524 [Paspalum notatum var. saurae]|uniref:KIB1-4 beta-propeller domain-containing protein n=1 Tax=Paspalum notatum var. saurae TaxID=547442 RepID=A0AAQ3PQE4_PASNO